MTGTETGLAGLSDDDLRRLEDLVEAALSSGDERGSQCWATGRSRSS